MTTSLRAFLVAAGLGLWAAASAQAFSVDFNDLADDIVDDTTAEFGYSLDGYTVQSGSDALTFSRQVPLVNGPYAYDPNHVLSSGDTIDLDINTNATLDSVFVGGANYSIAVVGDFNVLTMDVMGTAASPVDIVVFGTGGADGSSLNFKLFAPTFLWDWQLDQSILNGKDIGYITRIDFNGTIYMDNLSLALTSAPPTPAPEPASLALVTLALLGAGYSRHLQRSSKR